MSEEVTKPMTEVEAAAVDEMYMALTAFVKDVEASIPVTQNHYGRYMAIFGAVGDTKNQRGMARSLIRLGANAQGVADGFKAATGEQL